MAFPDKSSVGESPPSTRMPATNTPATSPEPRLSGARALERDVNRVLRRDVRVHAIAERAQIQIAKEVFARAEYHRRKREVHFVDQPSAQVLANGLGATADPHIAIARGSARLLECLLDATRDEVKDRSALHLERLSRMMGEHEDGNMIGRIVAPPAAPRFIRPFAAHRAEHVAPQNPRADILRTLVGKVFVDSGRPAWIAEHALERAGRIEPLV